MNKIVICEITSWYHYIGLIAYLEKEERNIGSIYIRIRSFLNKRQTIDLKLLEKYTNHISRYDKTSELIELLGETKKNRLTIVTTSELPINLITRLKLFPKRNKVKIITIEEGIGSYGGILQKISATIRETKGNKITTTAIVLAKEILRKTLKPLFQTENLHNFSKDGKSNIPQVSNLYGRAIKSIPQNNKNPDLTTPKNIYISAPYTELGLISKEKLAEKIHKYMPTDNIAIKPHPIEDQGKYDGTPIIKTHKPIELLVKENAENILSIFGGSNTCTYTLFLFFGIKTKRITSIDFFYEKLSKAQKNIIDKCSEPIDI